MMKAASLFRIPPWKWKPSQLHAGPRTPDESQTLAIGDENPGGFDPPAWQPTLLVEPAGPRVLTRTNAIMATVYGQRGTAAALGWTQQETDLTARRFVFGDGSSNFVARITPATHWGNPGALVRPPDQLFVNLDATFGGQYDALAVAEQLAAEFPTAEVIVNTLGGNNSLGYQTPALWVPVDGFDGRSGPVLVPPATSFTGGRICYVAFSSSNPPCFIPVNTDLSTQVIYEVRFDGDGSPWSYPAPYKVLLRDFVAELFPRLRAVKAVTVADPRGLGNDTDGNGTWPATDRMGVTYGSLPWTILEGAAAGDSDAVEQVVSIVGDFFG